LARGKKKAIEEWQGQGITKWAAEEKGQWSKAKRSQKLSMPERKEEEMSGGALECQMKPALTEAKGTAQPEAVV